MLIRGKSLMGARFVIYTLVYYTAVASGSWILVQVRQVRAAGKFTSFAFA